MSDYDNRPLSEQSIAIAEHRLVQGVNAKAVTPYAYDSLTGALTPAFGGLVPGAYDAVQWTNGGSNADIYTFYQGGLSGNLVGTLTVTYTTSAKSQIQSVARS